MKRTPNEDPDLKLIEELIFAPKGLTLERFSHQETVSGRTPDFRVYSSGELAAYCEVKSPRDDWLEEKLDDAPPVTLVGGLRSDPTFNRIARHVEKAATQFNGVNAGHIVPNILAFANHDQASSFNDLQETVTGMFHAEGGERFETMKYISEGRLGEAKKRIDLFVWVDVKQRHIQGYLFNERSPSQVSILCGLLRIDRSKIEH